MQKPFTYALLLAATLALAACAGVVQADRFALAKTALELIIVTDGFTRFEDVKQLCAYIGVSPTTLRSGSSVKGKGGIAKLGQGRMRQLLYLYTWTAKSCNPACKQLH